MPLPNDIKDQLSRPRNRFLLRKIQLSSVNLNEAENILDLEKHIQDEMRSAITVNIESSILHLNLINMIAEEGKASHCLQHLTLGRCDTNDDKAAIAAAIAAIIKDCNLITLDLIYSFFFEAKDLEKIVTAIATNQTLTSLTLSISFENCAASFNALTAASQQRPSLTDIWLTNITMGKQEIDALEKFFGANKKLKKISLSQMKDVDEDALVVMLINLIQANHGIEKIVIDHEFTHESTQLIADAANKRGLVPGRGKWGADFELEASSQDITGDNNRSNMARLDIKAKLHHFLTTNQIHSYASLLANMYDNMQFDFNDNTQALSDMANWALVHLENENNNLPIGHIVALMYAQFTIVYPSETAPDFVTRVTTTKKNEANKFFFHQLAAGIIAANKGIDLNSEAYYAIPNKVDTFLFKDTTFTLLDARYFSDSGIWQTLMKTFPNYCDTNYDTWCKLRRSIAYLEPNDLIELTHHEPLKTILMHTFGSNNIVFIDHLFVFPNQFPLGAMAADTTPKTLAELAAIAEKNMAEAKPNTVLNDIFAEFAVDMATNEKTYSREIEEAQAAAVTNLNIEDAISLAALSELLAEFDMTNKYRSKEIGTLKDIRDNLAKPGLEYKDIKLLAEKALKSEPLKFSFSATGPEAKADEAASIARQLLTAIASVNSFSGLSDCDEFKVLTAKQRKMM